MYSKFNKGGFVAFRSVQEWSTASRFPTFHCFPKGVYSDIKECTMTSFFGANWQSSLGHDSWKDG